MDISRYRNIPVPTSYMAYHSDYDFIGGYDHGKKAGILHVADHHVAPGKKQWTWGCGDFGQAWDRNLTDEDGPYIERKLFGTTALPVGFFLQKGGPASPNGEAGPFFQKTRRTVAASDKAAAARLALETRSR